MSSILRVEFFRLKRAKLFWVFLGVCFTLPLISCLFTQSLVDLLVKIADMGEMLGDMAVAGTVYQLISVLSGSSSNPALFAILFTAIFLGKEFSNGTMRNMLLANKSRAQVFFAYTVMAMLVGFAYLFANYVSALFFGGLFFGFEPLAAGKAISACLCTLGLGIIAMAFVQSCVCMFLFGTRKTSATIIAPLAICYFAPVLMVTAVESYLLIAEMGGLQINNAAMQWVPFYNALMFNAQAIDGTLVLAIALYHVVFAVFFAAMGYVRFRKADLK